MTTVLIIEDDEKSRRLLSDVLSFHGYHILQTDRGEQGVELLDAADDVSLVLMDIQLPGISGFEALARIRASTLRAQPKVVAVTASVMESDRRRILDAGFDACMPKPVNLKELLGTVRAMAG